MITAMARKKDDVFKGHNARKTMSENIFKK